MGPALCLLLAGFHVMKTEIVFSVSAEIDQLTTTLKPLTVDAV